MIVTMIMYSTVLLTCCGVCFNPTHLHFGFSLGTISTSMKQILTITAGLFCFVLCFFWFAFWILCFEISYLLKSIADSVCFFTLE